MALGKKALLTFAIPLLTVLTLAGSPPAATATCGYSTEITYFRLINGKRFPVGSCVKGCNESFFTCTGERTDDSLVLNELCC